MTEITQADRDAAAKFISPSDGDFDELSGLFARHRMEERAAIVEWLRKVGGSGPEVLADMIDAGEHLK